VKSIADHLYSKEQILDEAVNEVYGFYGESKKEIADIIENGLQIDRFGSEIITGRPNDSLFGSDHRIFPSSSLANQYAPCPICNVITKQCSHSPEEILRNEAYTMLIVRIVMGETHLCTEYNKEKYQGKKMAPGQLDSILGVTEDRKEMVVHNLDQIYCAYEIQYTRHLEKN